MGSDSPNTGIKYIIKVYDCCESCLKTCEFQTSNFDTIFLCICLGFALSCLSYHCEMFKYGYIHLNGTKPEKYHCEMFKYGYIHLNGTKPEKWICTS